jgi:hypothetical protein
MFSTNPPKWKNKEQEKHLRFAHFRARNRVAFESGHGGHGRRGSPAEAEAERYAHLCFVAAEVRDVLVEVEGVRVPGRISLPEDGALLFPFQPDKGRSARLPRRRAHVHLEYTVEGKRCSAESHAMQRTPDGPWLIELPRAIHVGTDRITARHRTPHGWVFHPRGHGPLAMVGTVRIQDLSVTGAALIFDEDPDLQPGQQLVGEIMGPRGRRFRVMAELCSLRPATDGHPDHVVGGVAFTGVGTATTAHLAAVIRSLHTKGHVEYDTEPGSS